jgi:IS4 transposase
MIREGMTLESHFFSAWDDIVARLGGAHGLSASAKATGACQRWKKIKNGAVLLRLVLAYCLSEFSLRGVCAWACGAELVDIANPSFLERLFNCENWLRLLVARELAKASPGSAQGRLIRLVDGTSVCKAEAAAKKQSNLWRIHSVYDLPANRFSFFELTDEKIGERLDMAPVVPGEIRIGDRCYLQPERMAAVIAKGGDLVVRAAWTNARWVDKAGALVNVVEILRKNSRKGKVDVPIWIACKSGKLIGVRLVAIKKPQEQALAAQREVIVAALKRNKQASKDALEAATWVIIATTLAQSEFDADEILGLYRLRWRIELAFKKLKSVIGLKRPPNKDGRSARVWVLAHLLMILLVEPLASELDVSPRKMAA